MTADDVGPVLDNDPLSEKIIVALKRDNPDLRVIEEAAYFRILSPQRCVLRRARAEEVLGQKFSLPTDLEKIMPSFKGKLSVSDEEMVWSRFP